MDARWLLNEFEHILSAPKGLQQIRELVLQLALSGDLNVRIVGDTPASKLFSDNIKAQERLIDHEQLKRQPALKRIIKGDEPWQLPTGWLWCRLGDVTNYGYASKVEFKDVDDQIWVLELEDIEKGTSRLMQRVRAHNRKFKSTKNRFVRGAVLYGKLRPYLDKVLIADEDGVCSTEIIPISFFKGIHPGYLRWYFKSPFFIAYATNSTRGMNLPRLGTHDARNAPFPFPPAEEQKHIVTKVGELMALCDKLEAQQQERKQLCKLTQKAALDDLARVQSSDALAVSWNRVYDNINLWLNDEDAIIELRNTVGFLGCRGLLTESNPFYITESNGSIVPLPPGWSWKTLGQLSEHITSGSRGWKKFIAPQGDIFIRSQDIKHDLLVFEDKAFVALPEQVEGMRTLVRPGDLLMTITGANVGKCVQVPQLTQRAYVSQHVALIRVSDTRHTPFLHWWITNSFGGQKHLAQYIYGDKPGLNLAQVGSIPIPLPPQEVQDRIVESLEHYKILFARLAAQVSEARNLAESLATAAVASITGIQIQTKEKMKAPKTELISTLRIGVSPTNREQAPLAAILIRNNGEMPAKTLWQASGLEIDVFYQHLKTEMERDWIVQPEAAYMREVEVS